MTFKIDDNIPPPEAKTGRGNAKYPFRQLEVGQSFFVPDKPAASMSSLASYKKPMKFAVRAEGTGARVWRIA